MPLQRAQSSLPAATTIPAPDTIKVNTYNSANGRVYINAMFALKELRLPKPTELYATE